MDTIYIKMTLHIINKCIFLAGNIGHLSQVIPTTGLIFRETLAQIIIILGIMLHEDNSLLILMQMLRLQFLMERQKLYDKER